MQAPVKIALVKTVPIAWTCSKFAPLRSAPLRFASLRFASLSFAFLRIAFLRIAFLRNVKLRNAKLRFTKLRFTKLRIAPLRSAPLRSAPLRSAPLRSILTSLFSGLALHAFQIIAPCLSKTSCSLFAIPLKLLLPFLALNDDLNRDHNLGKKKFSQLCLLATNQPD